MKKPPFKVALTVSALALMAGSLVLHERVAHTGGLEDLPLVKQVGVMVSSHGLMQLSDYNHFIAMQANLCRGQNPSPDDIDFAFRFAASHPGSSMSAVVQRTYAQSTLMMLSSSPQTDEVKQRLYAMSLPMLSGNPSDTTCAIVILGFLKDKRAVPYLRPFVNSQDVNERQCAVRSLHLLGVEVTPANHS